jgi:hypothetical protein
MNQVIDELIESARLAGSTQAKRGYGVYTQDDAIMERSFLEGVEARAKAIRDEVAALKAERERYRKALESMTRKEPCDCGCPSGKKAVILKPAHYYAIAAEALKGDAAIAKAEGRTGND